MFNDFKPDEKLTPREEFEQMIGPIRDEQWDWLKLFVLRNPVITLMTEEERAITEELGKLNARICATMGNEVTNDHFEVMLHIHALQNMMMSHAARRAYPDEFRGLGEKP